MVNASVNVTPDVPVPLLIRVIPPVSRRQVKTGTGNASTVTRRVTCPLRATEKIFEFEAVTGGPENVEVHQSLKE